MIERYSFGRMVVDGTTYTRDLIICPDRSIQGSWWRAAGHRLGIEDIDLLVQAHPTLIIAGTGAFGLMQPEKGLAEALSALGIAFEALPTPKAVSRYNETAESRTIGACFHLTC